MTFRLLEERGFRLAYTWPENRWVDDLKRVPTAFVMVHPDGRKVDFHAIRFDVEGVPYPEWDTDLDLSRMDLTGSGSVRGMSVRCTTAERQLRDHAEYDLPPDHARDMELLKESLRS